MGQTLRHLSPVCEPRSGKRASVLGLGSQSLSRSTLLGSVLSAPPAEVAGSQECAEAADQGRSLRNSVCSFIMHLKKQTTEREAVFPIRPFWCRDRTDRTQALFDRKSASFDGSNSVTVNALFTPRSNTAVS